MADNGITIMNEKAKKGFGLPYNVDVELFDKIMIELKDSGATGLKVDTLWINVGAAKDKNRSYSLSLAKYLGLVNTDKTNVWLTDLGLKAFRFASADSRRSILAKTMPEEYMAMFKWIKNEQELPVNELKQRYIESWEKPASLLIFDKAIISFLNYCAYLKLIKYIGKGNQARALITDPGKTALDSTPDTHEAGGEINAATRGQGSSTLQNDKALQPILKGNYPIKIITPDRIFDWDIKTETDLTVIDSVIVSIKEGWKRSTQSNGGNKSE